MRVSPSRLVVVTRNCLIVKGRSHYARSVNDPFVDRRWVIRSEDMALETVAISQVA